MTRSNHMKFRQFSGLICQKLHTTQKFSFFDENLCFSQIISLLWSKKHSFLSRILKEKFIPKWQDFFFSPTKRLYKGSLRTKILTSKELSTPLKFLPF